jgi:hypothetical protein
MPKKKKRDAHAEKERRHMMVPGPGAKINPDGSWDEPQPRGGVLKRTGMPAAKQPPASALRGRMRGHAAEQMHHAVEILSPQVEPCDECGQPKNASASDRLKALDLLCRYGIGVKFEKFSPDLVRALALAVQAEEHDPEVLRRIEARWALVLREHVTGRLYE